LNVRLNVRIEALQFEKQIRGANIFSLR